jgi:hypothetical protein
MSINVKLERCNELQVGAAHGVVAWLHPHDQDASQYRAYRLEIGDRVAFEITYRSSKYFKR